MATITVDSIILDAQVILQDTTGIRWPSAELLSWLNAGQRVVLGYKPNAFVKNAPLTLVAGTKQTLPADAVQLIDVPRNIGAGDAPGRAIRITMREVLDSQVPDWHAMTAVAVIKHYTYNLFDPKTFYVYPPAIAGTKVDAVYGATPVVAALGGVITIDDIYAAALLDYVLYRAYSKDTEFAADTNRAAAHESAFMAALTGKAKAEVGVNPNATAPANPNVTPNSR